MLNNYSPAGADGSGRAEVDALAALLASLARPSSQPD